jgi:hypothetical protein
MLKVISLKKKPKRIKYTVVIPLLQDHTFYNEKVALQEDWPLKETIW